MIRNEKCEVLDKQNFEPKYRMVYDTINEDLDQISKHFYNYNYAFKYF